MDHGAVGDGVTNDRPAVMSAINSLGGSLGYIYFPPGNYLFTSSVSIPDSAILKGFLSDSSTLLFDFGGNNGNCIKINGSVVSDTIDLDEGYSKDSFWVTTDSAFIFDSLDYAEIIQKNGNWDDVPANWAEYSVGQMVQVAGINGDTIFFTSPLRIGYEVSLRPRIIKIDPMVNAGVECLKIKRLDQANSGANISMNLAANCYVRGIESDVSVSAHVDIFRSTRILVEGNYFHHAFQYDGGSKRGYGVALNIHTGECLITNNVFRYLRHAMMVKTGANGNVFSYNYSREAYRSEPFHEWTGDISMHGHFPFANLFEGNIVQNIIIDHYWGPSGPHNTLFRNWGQYYGIIFTNGNPTTSDNQHIVGNDVTYNAFWTFLGGPYDITGTGHIQHGNNIDGTITPGGTGTLNDTSYYLYEEPVFWSVTDSWPSIGIPNSLASGTIPAKKRWDDGGTMTVCLCRKTWTGTVSTDWNEPHNWEPYGVPDEAAEVLIPGSTPNEPVISSTIPQSIRILNVETGAEVELSPGSSLEVLKK
jgi:hypothetical protein